MSTQTHDVVMTIDDLAAYLKLSKSTLYKLCVGGKVPGQKVGLRSQNVRRLRLDLTEVKFIPPDFHRQLSKSRLRPGDVVVVRTGEPGACAVVPEELTDANCSDLVIIRPGPRINARFLAYYVNEAAAHHVASHLVGAVQQHFNVGAARVLPIRLPSLTEQEAIVGVLGSHDDKIEQNRRTSRALERLARAVFKAWFVDFEPVKATRYRSANCNLRTQFQRIIRKAGLSPWPRLFHNLRATRQTELTERFPAHVVAAWIGNTERVAQNHYLQVTDAHFAQAIAEPDKDQPSANGAAQNPAQYPAVSRFPGQDSAEAENEKAPAFPGLANRYKSLQDKGIAATGLEPVTRGL